MDELLQSFQSSLVRLGIKQKDRLLLAVSGGLDSIVLTQLCILSCQDFGIAHANFQLRGKESERDENFVRQLALQHQKPFFTHRFDTENYATAEKCSVQVAARNLRYIWFETLMQNEPAAFQYVCTAHHLDDDIETVLMQFFRGTGIRGMLGIPKKRGAVIRPLLSVTRSEILKFANDQNLRWVEDSSNESDKYTRNYFRNQIIPSVKTIYPEFIRNMEKNLTRFSEVNILYEQAMLFHKKRLLKKTGNEVHIPILLLQKSSPLHTILFEIIREYNFSSEQTYDVLQLMNSENGKYILSPSHRIIRNRRWLIIAANATGEASHLIIDSNNSSITYPEGEINIQCTGVISAGFSESNTGTELLDADKIHFPLILRKCKSGDYFYPLGMTKKKKLARFFIDQKLSRTAKEKVWVLVMDSQIICVIGQRIDNRFKVTDSTKNFLLIKNKIIPVK